MGKIKVLIKEPYKKAEVKEVGDDLKNWQALVGGTIQVVAMPGVEEVDIICNDEGKLEALDGNFFLPEYEDCIVGTAVMVSYNDEGDFIGLNDEQIKLAKSYVEEYELKQGEDLYNDYETLYGKAINKMKEKEKDDFDM
jgi:hypothetical protein